MNRTKCFVWKHVKPVGSGTETNYSFGASATLVGGYLFLLGGSSQIFKASVLNIEERVWRRLDFEQSDSYRLLLHSATLYEDQMLIFGLRKASPEGRGGIQLGELHEFDPVANELKVVPTYGNDSQKPGFKKSHTADLYEQGNTLVVFGGRPFATRDDQQLYLLDLSSWTWIQPRAKGESPSLRSRHASALAGSLLFVYGGVQSNDLHTLDLSKRLLTWSTVHLPELGQHGRTGPTMTYIGDGRIIVYGGYTNGQNSSDLCVIERAASKTPAATLVRKALPAESPANYTFRGRIPSGRQSGCGLVCRNQMIIIGGNAWDKSGYYVLKPAT